MSKRSILVLVASLAMIFGAAGAFADNSLDVNAAAALSGNFGLEVITDGTSTSAYVAENAATNDETVYRGEFRLNRNDMVMANATGHSVFLGRRGGPAVNNLRIFLKFLNGDFKITMRTKNDGAGTANCGKMTIGGGGGIRVGFEWVASSGADDGECRLYKNGVEQFENTGLDNDEMEIDAIRFGVPQGVSATTSGSYYLDDFSSFRTLAP